MKKQVPWWLILGGLGVAIFYMARKYKKGEGIVTEPVVATTAAEKKTAVEEAQAKLLEKAKSVSALQRYMV